MSYTKIILSQKKEPCYFLVGEQANYKHNRMIALIYLCSEQANMQTTSKLQAKQALHH